MAIICPTCNGSTVVETIINHDIVMCEVCNGYGVLCDAQGDFSNPECINCEIITCPWSDED